MSFWRAGVFLLFPLLAGVGSDCVKGFEEVGRGLPVLVTKHPITWEEVVGICETEFGAAGLLQLDTNLTDEDKEKCGEVLVPVDLIKRSHERERVAENFATRDELKLRDESYPRLSEGIGALNLSSGLWQLVNLNFSFPCGICKLRAVTEIDISPIYIDNWNRHRITLRSQDIYPGQVNISVAEMKSLLEEVKKVIALNPKSLVGQEENIVSRTVPVDNGYQVVFKYNFQAYGSNDVESQWKPVLEAAKGNDVLEKYDIKIENVDICPKEESAMADGKSTVWPAGKPGTSQSRLEESTGVFKVRRCEFNLTGERFLWSTPTFWELSWGQCTVMEMFASDIHYYEYLGTTQNILKQRLTDSTTINRMTLATLGYTIDNELLAGVVISKTLTKDLGTILQQFPLGQSDHSHIVSLLYVQLVAIDLEVDGPNDGISMAYQNSRICNFECPKSPIKIKLTSRVQPENQESEQFSVQLSQALISVSKRLAFVVYWEARALVVRTSALGLNAPRKPVINIALRLKEDVGTLSDDAEEYYVDVSYLFPTGSISSIGCGAWDDNLDDRVVGGCRYLKLGQGNLTVYRCAAKCFLQDGASLAAKYAIYDRMFNHIGIEVRPNGLGTVFCVVIGFLICMMHDLYVFM